MVLTNEGEILYNYIKEGIPYFINGKNRFDSLKKLESGVINIGSTTTISETYLIPYFKKFNELYPNIKINITNDLTDNLIKNLRNGNLDIVIMSYINEIKDLKMEYLTDLNDIFVTNKKINTELNIKKILEEGIMVQKYPLITMVNFNNFLKENDLVCNIKMEVVSYSLLTNLTLNGFGISLLTKEYIMDKLNNTLFEIKTDVVIPKRTFGYAVKNNECSSFATKEFIKILKEKSL